MAHECSEPNRTGIRGSDNCRRNWLLLRLGLLLASALAGGCSEDDYPPIADSDEELMLQVADLLVCGASANNEVTHRPTFEGQVVPTEAMQCVHDMIEGNDHIYPVSDEQIGEKCGFGIACTPHDGTGCGGAEIFIPENIIPDGLVGISEGGALYERSSMDLASVLYHEGIHTVQGLDDCKDKREIEAYDQQSTFMNWMAGQISSFLPELPSGGCTTPLDEAPGLSPCVLSVIEDAFPELDISEPLPEPACGDMKDLAHQASKLAQDASTLRAQMEESAITCMAMRAASSNIQAVSTQWVLFVAALPEDPLVYQFARQPDGTNELVRTYNTGFSDIKDLSIIQDALGRDILLAAGIFGGHGAILASRDVAGGEFGGDPDGLFDENITTLTSDTLIEASQLVQAGTSPLLVFDQQFQAAYEILLDAAGEPSALADNWAILVPLGSDAVSLVHEPDRPTAYAKLRFEDSAAATRLLQFDDVDMDGSYTYVGEGTAEELGRLPPEFLTTPAAGSSGVWVRGGIGHTIEIAPSDGLGTMGAAIGSGVIPLTGRLWLTTNRAFVGGEYLRIKDTTSSLLGLWRTVIAPRIQAYFYVPHWGPESGGTSVSVRGQGFTGISSVKFDGNAVAFQVVDDRRMIITTPAGTGVGRITATNANGQREIGSFRFDVGTRNKRWDTAAEFASWLPDGTGGWWCGGYAIPPTNAPASGDRAGCFFMGNTGKWGYLQSPTITLSGTGRLFLRVEHTSSFGPDGDGAIVQVGDAASWYTLRPIARSVDRLDGASCSGSGSSRTCLTDPSSHGALGDAGGACNNNWREDVYELPSTFDSASWLKIRIAASNMSASAGATYLLGAVELVSTEDPRAASYGSWTTIASFDTSCGGVTVTGPFNCTSTSPLTGNVGPVLRYWNAGGSSTGTASLPFTAPVAGHRLSLRVRHALDFTAGSYVGSGLGRLQICCGTCTTVTPVYGYPPVAPGATAGFGDEGPERVWMTDEVDLSAWAGSGACTVRLLGTGAAASGQPGWVVDSMSVRVR